VCRRYDADLSQYFRKSLTFAENLAKLKPVLYSLLEVLVFTFEPSLQMLHLLKSASIGDSASSVIREYT
jgi:hypothetical protein